MRMRMRMMMRGDECATYLIDEPLFMPICLLSYSINSSSRAAAFSESIQNSFLSGDICGLLRRRCDFARHIPFFSVMRRTRTLMVSSFRSSGMCWQLPKGKHIGTGLGMILKSIYVIKYTFSSLLLYRCDYKCYLWCHFNNVNKSELVPLWPRGRLWM